MNSIEQNSLNFINFIKSVIKCKECNEIIIDPYIGSKCSDAICSNCFKYIENKNSRKRKKGNIVVCQDHLNSEFKKYQTYADIFSILHEILNLKDTSDLNQFELNAVEEEHHLVCEDVEESTINKNDTLVKGQTCMPLPALEEDTVFHEYSPFKAVDASVNLSANNRNIAESDKKDRNVIVTQTQPPNPLLSDDIKISFEDKSKLIMKFLKDISLEELKNLVIPILSTPLRINQFAKILLSVPSQPNSFEGDCITETDLEDTISCDNNEVVKTNLDTNKPRNPPLLIDRKIQSQGLDHAQLSGSKALHKDIQDSTKIILTTSRLWGQLKKKVSEFCTLFSVNLMNDIDSKCTHLILQTGFNIICKINTFYIDERCEVNRNSYTFKYIYAIASKMFIVSHNWILESLNQGKLIPAAPYEVKADREYGETKVPMISRLSPDHLFHNFCIFLLDYENSLLSKEQISLVLKAGKAVVETNIDKLDSHTKNTKVIVAIISKDSKDQTMRTRFRELKIPIVNQEWPLQCILYYKILPYSDYPSQ